MNIEEYIIKVNGLTYVKDLILDRLLLVDSIESVTSIPSERKERTLYMLSDTIHYYSNFEISQVELEKQEIVEEKSTIEEVQEVEETQLNKRNEYVK